jgi:membrane protease YdiL (CAAX protease family)
MKCCDYCGKENADALLCCAECGTDLTLPVLVPPLIPRPRVLNAKYATIILLIFLAAQLIGACFGVLLAAVIAPLGNIDSHGTAALRTTLPYFLLAAQLSSAITLVWISKRLGFPLKDTSPTGAAWVWGRWRDVAEGLMIGVLVYFVGHILFSVSSLLNPHYPQMDYWRRMSMNSGFTQIAWAVSALLFAPPIEELLFRGVLYGGYRKSFGPVGAAVITTFVFVLLHFLDRPVEALCIGGVALTALWLRLRSRAIGPAIGCHFAYNAMVVMTTFWWR